MTPRDRDALERIIECIQAVDAYVSRAGADWPTDGMAVDAIAKRIEEIGEVAKRITPETLALMPSINWRGVKGIREVMAHDYDDVDVEILVGVVRDNLPGLTDAVAGTLKGSNP
jgi:uncharacterized protein with HEPN domain